MEGFRSRGWFGKSWLVLGASVVAALLGGESAFATIRLHDLGLGKMELSGNIQTQNIARQRDIRTYSFIQQRNVFRARIDWDLLRGGQLFDKFEIPGVRKSKLFMLYRFAYDSIYDYTPAIQMRYDLRGLNLNEAFNGEPDLNQRARFKRSITLAGIPENERDAYKFDNQLREVYVDLKLAALPLSLRIGRQQVVWGETDNFRMLDRVNPLDVSWHMVQELPPPMFGWDEIRRPLFMVKGLWDLGNIGPISQSFVELFYNPGDWYPAKVAFLPRPWGIPILDPLTNPWDGAFNSALCTTRTADGGPCTRLMNDTKLFKQGNYDRWDPRFWDKDKGNGQVGLRFHGYSPQGIEFTLNYLHQRWSGDDGTNSAPVRGLRVFDVDNSATDPANARSARLLERGVFPAEYIAPYVNTVGVSANYSDEANTQAVFRLETILDFGIPFYDRGKKTVADNFLPGVSEKNMWKGMLGFDRPTWIRLVNNKTTVFLSGQWFWHYLMNNPDCPDNLWDPAALQEFQRNGGHCLTGGLDLPSEKRTLSQGAFRDKIRDWETLITFAAFTFYRGGSVVPVIGYALDPVNRYSSEFFWTVDYFVTPNIALNVAQRFFIDPTAENFISSDSDNPNFESWGLNSFSRGRSETSLRITYNY
jgi:Protein of unknown function (DUF1302)